MDKDVDLKCCLLSVDFLLIRVLNVCLHQMLSDKLPCIGTTSSYVKSILCDFKK